MRIARVRGPDGPSWAVLDDDVLHLLSGAPWTSPGRTGRVLPLADAQLLAPAVPSKVLCVGRNYEAHRREMGYEAAATPSVFLKPPTTVVGPDEDVELPPTWLSGQVEHEAELAVVIGRAARMVAPEQALDHVLGYTCADDVSARDLQRSDAYPTRGKGFDTFCPLGPWIETGLDLDQGPTVQCRVNGSLRQEGSTRDMTLSVPWLLSHLSQFTTLLPGDVVLTGSPGGTGPLGPGDQVEVEVSGVGVLRHGVVASRWP